MLLVLLLLKEACLLLGRETVVGGGQRVDAAVRFLQRLSELSCLRVEHLLGIGRRPLLQLRHHGGAAASTEAQRGGGRDSSAAAAPSPQRRRSGGREGFVLLLAVGKMGIVLMLCGGRSYAVRRRIPSRLWIGADARGTNT